MVLIARGSAKESTFGPKRMMSPCFLCKSMCVHCAFLPLTSKYRHQLVYAARGWPGYLFRPLLNLFWVNLTITPAIRMIGQ
jgi:hypothetical protein